MKRKAKKLILSRETLVNMEDRQMKTVVGGTIIQSNCMGCAETATDCSNRCTRTICSNCCP